MEWWFFKNKFPSRYLSKIISHLLSKSRVTFASLNQFYVAGLRAKNGSMPDVCVHLHIHVFKMKDVDSHPEAGGCLIFQSSDK